MEKDLSTVEQVQRAHDLGLSALLGTIYNFGELVGLPLDLVISVFVTDSHLPSAANASNLGKFDCDGIRMDQESAIRFQRWRYREI